MIFRDQAPLSRCNENYKIANIHSKQMLIFLKSRIFIQTKYSFSKRRLYRPGLPGINVALGIFVSSGSKKNLAIFNFFCTFVFFLFFWQFLIFFVLLFFFCFIGTCKVEFFYFFVWRTVDVFSTSGFLNLSKVRA